MYKRWFIFGLFLLLIIQLIGCTKHTEAPISNNETPVNLIYYTIGEPDNDLRKVNDKINEVLLRKIGITITYNKIGWQEYDSRLNTIISSDTPLILPLRRITLRMQNRESG